MGLETKFFRRVSEKRLLTFRKSCSEQFIFLLTVLISECHNSKKCLESVYVYLMFRTNYFSCLFNFMLDNCSLKIEYLSQKRMIYASKKIEESNGSQKCIVICPNNGFNTFILI